MLWQRSAEIGGRHGDGGTRQGAACRPSRAALWGRVTVGVEGIAAHSADGFACRGGVWYHSDQRGGVV